MKAVTALLLALALTGCATCREHPVACTYATAIAAGSLLLMSGHHGNRNSGVDNRIQTPTVNCAQVSCQ